MIATKTTERGFTLVEVVVVGILLSVLALGAFSLFMMYSNTSRVTAAHLRLQRQAEALVDVIAQEVREARFVVPLETDVPGIIDEDGTFTSTSFFNTDDVEVKQFFVRNAGGTTVSRFNLVNDGGGIGTVQMNGVPFSLGGEVLRVDFANSEFLLRGDRRQVAVDIVLRTVANNGDVFTLNVQRGSFRCRN